MAQALFATSHSDHLPPAAMAACIIFWVELHFQPCQGMAEPVCVCVCAVILQTLYCLALS